MPGLNEKCMGGQYANDVVALEDSEANVDSFCEHMFQWGQKWGMELGYTKCGVMLFSQNEELLTAHKEHVYKSTEGTYPTVNEYKYLGITMTPALPARRTDPDNNELDYIKRQVIKGKKTIGALRPLLRDPLWPLPVKVMLITTFLMSRMTYGAEWIGYKRLHAIPLQGAITKAIKMSMGILTKSRVFDPLTISYELSIPTAEEVINLLRVRLSAKLQFTDKCKTWLKRLHDHPFKNLNKTWITTNTKWEKEKVTEFAATYKEQPLRKWVAEGHAYERHTRCNSYENTPLNVLRSARSDVDQWGFYHENEPEGVLITDTGIIPDTDDVLAERIAGLDATRSQNKTPAE